MSNVRGGRDMSSYEIQWMRADPKPRPDFQRRPASELFISTDGKPLFTVVVHEGPSEGIFTLIAEAPRLRDEIDEIIGGPSA